MHDIQSLKNRLNELGIRPNKKLGQNFLVNTEIAEKIVRETERWNVNSYIEIGPGAGALTDLLIQTGKPFQVIELDRSLSEYWAKQGVKVIVSDALKVDWSQFEEGETLISNLPFQISSTLLIDLSVEPNHILNMMLMFQKEVGQRIVAQSNSGDYGLLSVIAQTFWVVDKFIDVGPKDFYPPPKVASRVIKFKRKKSHVLDPKKFLGFVKSAFAQRRKMLIKNISQFTTTDKIKQFFQELDILETARAENLSPEQFQQLFVKIMEAPECMR